MRRLMRLPPTSTLFPYTTLFRSHPVRLCSYQRRPALGEGSDGRDGAADGAHPRGRRSLADRGRGSTVQVTAARRSEEHTSELQSRGHIVCRLLLEYIPSQHFSSC